MTMPPSTFQIMLTENMTMNNQSLIDILGEP